MAFQAKPLLRLLAVLIAVAAFLAGALFALSYLYLHDLSFRKQPFSAETWRSGNERTRGSMIADLMERDLLHGKSPSEITDLLGTPDSTNDPWFKHRPFLIYKLDVGLKFGHEIWPHYLEVELDPTGTNVRNIGIAD